MPKCPPTGGVRLQEVSVSGGAIVFQDCIHIVRGEFACLLHVHVFPLENYNNLMITITCCMFMIFL